MPYMLYLIKYKLFFSIISISSFSVSLYCVHSSVDSVEIDFSFFNSVIPIFQQYSSFYCVSDVKSSLFSGWYPNQLPHIFKTRTIWRFDIGGLWTRLETVYFFKNIPQIHVLSLTYPLQLSRHLSEPEKVISNGDLL